MFPLKIKVILLICISITSIYLVISGSFRILYKGLPSDHFDGRRFFYKGSTHSFTDMVKWIWQMETVEWPAWVDDPPQAKPVEHVKAGELKITYINHATLLIQIDGINILTDPIWSEGAGPISFLSTKRVRAPGIKLDDLPRIDVILISHDHYDHLDQKTLSGLSKTHKPKILAGLGVKSLLNEKKFPDITELDWWQYSVYKNLKVTFVPARHNSGRAFTGSNKTLWGGFVIESPEGKVYFAGDTAYDDFIPEIGKKFGQFRLTVLPIGSYEKRWYMKTQHMNPEESVKTHILLKSKQSVGFHYATFKEHPEQAINAHEKDLSIALKKYEVPETAFWVLQFGEGRYVRK
ncbi:MAG: MBL fold metallo-hydrolase [Clostridia bacterium]|nr:MBL fold metallo-hydrolase [Clostridia bacterium]